jgi:YfiH family protein
MVNKRTPTRSQRRPNVARLRTAGAWHTLRAGELQILQAKALREFPKLVHGFSTRPGGASEYLGGHVLNLGFTQWDSRPAVFANRQRFFAALRAEKLHLVTLRQVHSDVIHTLRARPDHPLRGDAFITPLPGLLLGVQTADCVPILLFDPRHRVIAAIHTGWRGTLKRIAAKTVGRMRMDFGTRPGDIVAALGPGIGRCCYEVGPEVVQAFAGQFAAARDWFEATPTGRHGQMATFDDLSFGEEPNPLKWLWMTPPGHDPPPPRLKLDLIAANRWQLLDAGLAPGNIFASDFCTACRADLFFSYRREGSPTGRMLSVIGLL